MEFENPNLVSLHFESVMKNEELDRAISAFDEAIYQLNQEETFSANLTPEKLIELAASMGLEVKGPKKVFIKHSYSITSETKERFQDLCRSLGMKMQDAMEEAMQDFFIKYDEKFSAVKKAKNL